MLTAIASRVAVRHARRVLGSKAMVQQAMAEFLRARREIGVFLAKHDVDRAKQRFLELGKALEPLAGVLDDVKMTRADEQRKLKNVRMWLARLRRSFESKFLDLGVDEVDIYLDHRLEWIGDTLKSLSRVSDRLEAYGGIEKTFTHGPWTIDNRYGFTKDQYSEPLEVLDAATHLVAAKGLSVVLYGDVRLETKENNPGAAGQYFEASDYIALYVDARHRHSGVFTLVHELGHRYWYKAMSSAQREAYEDHYSSGGVTLEQRHDMFQALVKAQFRPGAARRFLNDPSLPIVEFFKEYGAYSGKPSENWKTYQTGAAWLEKNLVRPRERYLRLQGVKIETVSDYANTNVREDYAETFAHHVCGLPIPDSVMTRFAPTV